LNSSNPFETAGNWYKANLHAHTTESDGMVSPTHLAGWYRSYGYDILAITDHGKVTDPAIVEEPDILCIPGAELSVGRSSSGGDFHVVALGLDDVSSFSNDMTLQDAVDAVQDAGGVSFVAHPYWSCLSVSDLDGVEGLRGIEVYNHGCELEIAKGFSSVHWDDLLLRGARLTAIAVDDCHRCGWDFFGGWTMIRTPTLTPEAVLDALRLGHYYCTMGPQILELRVSNGKVTVECTDAASIHFVANNQQGYCVHADHRPPLQGATYRLSGHERYVRVEVVSPSGLRAWSQPIFLT